IFGCILAAGAVLTYRSYGINKNDATPSWCLWASAITCWLWVLFALAIDAGGTARWWKFFIDGGQNVLLAYLLAPLLASLITLLGITWYGHLGAHAASGII